MSAPQGTNSGGGGGGGGRKESVVGDLTKYLNRSVRVKFSGGREVVGTLKGWDQLCSLVLDDCVEHLREPEDANKITDKTRQLGLVVCRGTAVLLLAPVDGLEQIENPFAAQTEG